MNALFFLGQILTPQAAQKPRKVIQETKTFFLATNTRHIWVSHIQCLRTPQETLANCTLYTREFKTGFQNFHLYRPDIIPTNPQTRSYKAMLPYVLNHLTDMTPTSRKRGHWPNVTETLLVSLYLRLFSCQDHYNRIRYTQQD